MENAPRNPADSSFDSDFVQRFHVAFDGSFPDVETSVGPSSYALLAAEAEALSQDGVAPRVVDLGCGSGRLCEVLIERGLPPENLVGVDFVAEQIDRTRERLRGAPVRLVHARSQELPLADGSVDCVLNHMGLAVMVPVTATIREIGRVLRPGGRMAVVVDGPPVEGSIDKAYNRIIRKIVAEEVTDLGGSVVTGEDVSVPEVLAGLMRQEAGMEPLRPAQPFQLLMRMALGEYLEFLEGEYLMRVLQAGGRQRVRDAVAQLFEGHCDDRVVIPLAMQLMVFAKPQA
jgi:SAM-dependent methyltransferase